jgi:hypothetical protein
MEVDGIDRTTSWQLSGNHLSENQCTLNIIRIVKACWKKELREFKGDAIYAIFKNIYVYILYFYYPPQQKYLPRYNFRF